MDDEPTTGSGHPSNADTHAKPAPAPSPGEPRRWGWLIPGVTFLVGLALGGIVVFAQQSGSNTASSGGTSTPSPSVTLTPPGGEQSSQVAVVKVPSACLSVADDARNMVDIAAKAVSAARDLDAAALASAVRQLDEAQKAVTSSATACRSVQALLPTATATPSPTT